MIERIAIERPKDPDSYLMRAFPAVTTTVTRALAAKASLRQHAAGERLAESGDAANHLIVVGAGRVEETVKKGARTFVLRASGPGDLIELSPWRVEGLACVAVEPTTVAWLPLEDFRRFACEWPDLLTSLMAKLSERAAMTERRLADMALLEVRERVLAELDRCAVPETGSARRVVRLTHQQLADRIGSCRETVSRICTELIKAGLLQRPRHRLYVLLTPPPAALTA